MGKNSKRSIIKAPCPKCELEKQLPQFCKHYNNCTVDPASEVGEYSKADSDFESEVDPNSEVTAKSQTFTKSEAAAETVVKDGSNEDQVTDGKEEAGGKEEASGSETIYPTA